MIVNSVLTYIKKEFKSSVDKVDNSFNETTIYLNKENTFDILKIICFKYGFQQLVDVSVVDYLKYGHSEWETTKKSTGFSRAVKNRNSFCLERKNRFLVVYHVLNLKENTRLRIKVTLPNEDFTIPSVINIWPSAEWPEREAFDMFGIIFLGHPDLRRILTDYGFIGYPLRKDFPQSGKVGIRYDSKNERIVYEPVEIEPRINVPKIIRSN